MDFINRFFRDDQSSKDKAVERLRVALVHDRATVNTGLMESLKEELMDLITKYMDIDEENMEVKLDSEGNTTALVANIPVKRIKR